MRRRPRVRLLGVDPRDARVVARPGRAAAVERDDLVDRLELNLDPELSFISQTISADKQPVKWMQFQLTQRLNQLSGKIFRPSVPIRLAANPIRLPLIVSVVSRFNTVDSLVFLNLEIQVLLELPWLTLDIAWA
jgi:hypothetical protein